MKRNLFVNFVAMVTCFMFVNGRHIPQLQTKRTHIEIVHGAGRQHQVMTSSVPIRNQEQISQDRASSFRNTPLRPDLVQPLTSQQREMSSLFTRKQPLSQQQQQQQHIALSAKTVPSRPDILLQTFSSQRRPSENANGINLGQTGTLGVHQLERLVTETQDNRLNLNVKFNGDDKVNHQRYFINGLRLRNIQLRHSTPEANIRLHKFGDQTQIHIFRKNNNANYVKSADINTNFAKNNGIEIKPSLSEHYIPVAESNSNSAQSTHTATGTRDLMRSDVSALHAQSLTTDNAAVDTIAFETIPDVSTGMASVISALPSSQPTAVVKSSITRSNTETPVHDPTTFYTVNTTANMRTAKPLPTANEVKAAPYTTKEVELSLVKDIARTVVDALMNANNIGLVTYNRENASNNVLLNTNSDIFVKVDSVSQKTTDTAIMNKPNKNSTAANAFPQNESMVAKTGSRPNKTSQDQVISKHNKTTVKASSASESTTSEPLASITSSNSKDAPTEEADAPDAHDAADTGESDAK